MYKCLKFLCNLMKLIHPTMQCWDNAFAESLWKCLKDFKQKKQPTNKKLRMVNVLLDTYSIFYDYILS